MAELKNIALFDIPEIGYARGILRGAYRYAKISSSWVLHRFQIGYTDRQFPDDWQIAGALGYLNDRQMVDMFRERGIPLVNTSNTRNIPDCPRVGVDDIAVGEAAARYYLELGLDHFAFIGPAEKPYGKDRLTGFRRKLAHAGKEPHLAPAPNNDHYHAWLADYAQAARWLNTLPKPIGLYAVTDWVAEQVVMALRFCDAHVPEEMALLGTDDDELVCEGLTPPLSSISIPTEQIGWEAARLLDEMLSGKQPPDKPVLLPPGEIQTRQSTDVLAVADPEVAAAVRFIRQNASESIAVEDVLRAVPMSRRKLEQRFRRILGRTPLAEIRRVHLDQAKDLLTNTDAPIYEVARSSGFSSPERLAVVFKKSTGISPTEYRDQFRLR
ncbi:MAG: substrate-binding domain-containing protein [Phycisphaerae bacterium]